MNVITVLEQEHGTELDLVPTQLHLVMAGVLNPVIAMLLANCFRIWKVLEGLESLQK